MNTDWRNANLWIKRTYTVKVTQYILGFIAVERMVVTTVKFDTVEEILNAAIETNNFVVNAQINAKKLGKLADSAGDFIIGRYQNYIVEMSVK